MLGNLLKFALFFFQEIGGYCCFLLYRLRNLLEFAFFFQEIGGYCCFLLYRLRNLLEFAFFF